MSDPKTNIPGLVLTEAPLFCQEKHSGWKCYKL